MTTTTQTQNMNAFIEAFITEHGSEEMVAMWQSEEIQSEFMKLAKKCNTKKTGKKDPNKPKRGKSAYIFFCAENRPAVKTNLGDEAKATEVTAELGRLWSELKESTKSSDQKKLAQYEEQAKADKERYLTEIADYEPTSEEDLEEKPKGRGRGKKSSGKKDPNKPKRGKSSYIFFCADHRAEVKTNLGDEAKNTEIIAELGRLWNDLKESTKSSNKKKLAKYEAQAKADKERYLNEMAEYEPKSDEETTVQNSSDSEQGSEIQDDVPESPKKEKKKKKEEPEEKEKKEKSPKKSSEKKTTGYSLFQKAFREDVKEENPDMKPAEITKLLAGMWKDLDKAEQQEWKDNAASC